VRNAQPPWRSLLFVPATARRFVARAHERGADVVILDLEDGVAPAERDAGRAALAVSAASVGQAGAVVAVRINRPLALAAIDIDAAVMPAVGALVLPKVEGPDDLRWLADAVAAREVALGMPVGHTGLIGQVETAGALARLEAIATATPRLAALGFGNEDLAADLGAEPGPDLFVPLGVRLVAAARAAGVRPIGTVGPFAEIADLDTYRAGLERSRRLGYAGVTCIHPAQVAEANAAFGATGAEVARATAILAAFEAAVARGEGAVAFEGAMVDRPVAERARQVLRRAGALPPQPPPG